MTTKTIINHRKHDLVNEDRIRLRPGENVLGEDKAKALARSGSGKTWFSLGWIGGKPAPKAAVLAEAIDVGTQDGDDADTTPPGPMSAREAIDFVGDESDVSVLRGMLEGEDRKTVRAAVERRLDELDEPGGGEGDGGVPGGTDAPDEG